MRAGAEGKGFELSLDPEPQPYPPRADTNRHTVIEAVTANDGTAATRFAGASPKRYADTALRGARGG